MIAWFALKLAGVVGPTWAKRLAGPIIWVLAIVIIGGLIWWRVDAYGDRRFDAGVALERGKWEAAEEKLKQEASASATRADDAAAKRLEVHKEQVDAERQSFDQAVRDGTSPLDVLFGG